MKDIHIALLGFGTVGSGVAEAIRRNGDALASQLGARLHLKTVLVRDAAKYASHELLQGVRLTTDFAEIANDDEISIVIEVMGGLSPAKEYIFAALEKGKSVVSANKDLVALCGPEIIRLAEKNHVNFSCEASVGGGIPILVPLHDSLAANRIDKILGIVNGTTNYILTAMTDTGESYETALAEAQEKGFAEADPTNDVCGYDAARKLAILASIGFRANVTFDDVAVEGIDKITQQDVLYAKDMGYVIKLLAVATREEGGISLNVYPAFVPKAHPLASVKGSYNAIYVVGNIVDDVMFYGRGAGSLPTASAVMGDVIATAKHIVTGTTGTGMILTETQPAALYSPKKLRDSYYFRLIVKDATGVLAGIAQILADHEISINEVVQKRRFQNCAELMLIVESAPRENIEKVIETLTALPTVVEIANVIRVLANGNE